LDAFERNAFKKSPFNLNNMRLKFPNIKDSGAIERIKPVCGANKLIKPWVYRQPAGLYCPAGRAPSLGKAFAPHHRATKIVRRAHFTHGVSTNDDAALWCIVNFVDFRQLKTHREAVTSAPHARFQSPGAAEQNTYFIHTYFYHLLFLLNVM
jgi:hypothetical protein